MERGGMMQEAGRKVLITGAAGGIGVALAKAFLGENAAVGLIDRDEESLQRTVAMLRAEHLGAIIHSTVADVTDESGLEHAVRTLVGALGGLGTLIVNAGVMSRIRFADLDSPALGEVMDINVLGAYRTVRAALPALQAWGDGASIVTMASAGGLNPRSVTGPAYRISKAALIAMTKVLAVELLADGIRVNCVAPGGVDGGMSSAFSSDELRDMRDPALGARLASTDEVARAATFLAGSESSFTTGSIFVVAGGAFI